MKGKIVRGIAGAAAAVLAVISVYDSVFAQDTETVLLSYPEEAVIDKLYEAGSPGLSYPELTDKKMEGYSSSDNFLYGVTETNIDLLRDEAKEETAIPFEDQTYAILSVQS